MRSTTTSPSSRSASSRQSSHRSCSAPTDATASSRCTRPARSPRPTMWRPAGPRFSPSPPWWPASPRRCSSHGMRSTPRTRGRGWRTTGTSCRAFCSLAPRSPRSSRRCAVRGVLHTRGAPTRRSPPWRCLHRLGGRRNRRGELHRAARGRASRSPGCRRYWSTRCTGSSATHSTTDPCRVPSPPSGSGPSPWCWPLAVAAHDELVRE